MNALQTPALSKAAHNIKFAINITSCKFAPAQADLFIVQPVRPDPGSGILIIIGLIALTELINDKKLSLKQFPTVYQFSVL
jgi:hypothetical protein